MTYRSFSHLQAALDNAFNDVLLGVSLDQWDENHLTYSMVTAIRDTLGGQTVDGPDPARIFFWAFKANGNLENTYGDLALLIDLRFADGTNYEGAAVLEAKKRELRGHRLPEIRVPQLRRIAKNARYPQLLIYDREPVEGRRTRGVARGILQPWGWEPYEVGRVGSRAVVVPLVVPLSTGSKDTWLYKFAMPFAEQIATRYLHGLDVDPDEALLKLVKGRANDVPRYVVAITVLHGSVTGALPDLPPPEVNHDALLPLGPQDFAR